MAAKGSPPVLRPKPAYLEAFTKIMARIQRTLGAKVPTKPIEVYVAGGAAMHFYTAARHSDDIDAVINARVLLDPQSLQVAYRDEDGRARLLYFDTQYNDTFALLHPEAYDEALPITLKGIDPRKLNIKLLAPLDLAVSKLSRFESVDQEDIRVLARLRLIDSKSLRRRAESALPGYVGNLERIRNSIDIASKMIG